MQENYEKFKDFIQTVGLLYSLTVRSRDIKKALKMIKKSSENDQSELFFFYSVPSTLNLKKIP